MTRSPAALYRRSSDATHGSERRQLIQPYVQTSIKTTCPLSSEIERGDELIHICGSRVGKSGAIWSRGSTEPADERYLAASTMPQISARTDIPARKERNRLTTVQLTVRLSCYRAPAFGGGGRASALTGNRIPVAGII